MPELTTCTESNPACARKNYYQPFLQYREVECRQSSRSLLNSLIKAGLMLTSLTSFEVFPSIASPMTSIKPDAFSASYISNFNCKWIIDKHGCRLSMRPRRVEAFDHHLHCKPCIHKRSRVVASCNHDPCKQLRCVELQMKALELDGDFQKR